MCMLKRLDMHKAGVAHVFVCCNFENTSTQTNLHVCKLDMRTHILILFTSFTTRNAPIKKHVNSLSISGQGITDHAGLNEFSNPGPHYRQTYFLGSKRTTESTAQSMPSSSSESSSSISPATAAAPCSSTPSTPTLPAPLLSSRSCC